MAENAGENRSVEEGLQEGSRWGTFRGRAKVIMLSSFTVDHRNDNLRNRKTFEVFLKFPFVY